MRVAAVRSILFALMMMAIGSVASAQIGVQISIAPPALPVYEQPVCPGDGYIWTPGYWAYAEDGGYYWVPGTWIIAPEVGFLWTPGYWGWGNGFYAFHDGYWGPHVGFYGGISYGFGYFGNGYEGGRWDNGHFFYNRSVTNINVTNIHNVYNTTVINRTDNRVSFNGGNGGVEARPSAEETRFDSERHVGPVAAQRQHVEAARANPELRASANQGRPPIAATQRAGEFKGENVVAAKEAGGAYHAPENTGARNEAAEHTTAANTAAAAKATHAKELSPPTRNTLQPTGNAKTDAKYQQQQQKIVQQQDRERTQLAQKQEAEHTRAAQQKVNDQKQQQMEQRHAQQTQQLQQKHEQQQTHFESHAAPAQHSAPSGGSRPK
jgi:hypothetical protein